MNRLSLEARRTCARSQSQKSPCATTSSTSVSKAVADEFGVMCTLLKSSNDLRNSPGHQPRKLRIEPAASLFRDQKITRGNCFSEDQSQDRSVCHRPLWLHEIEYESIVISVFPMRISDCWIIPVRNKLNFDLRICN